MLMCVSRSNPGRLGVAAPWAPAGAAALFIVLIASAPAALAQAAPPAGAVQSDGKTVKNTATPRTECIRQCPPPRPPPRLRAPECWPPARPPVCRPPRGRYCEPPRRPSPRCHVCRQGQCRCRGGCLPPPPLRALR